MAIPDNDTIWADFNLDGSVKEPFKQDIRRKMNFIEALATAAGVGAKAYSTKAAMDADLSQPDGTIGAIYADATAANNYPTLWYWNDAGNVWAMGVDRISALANQLHGSTGALDGIFAATGAYRPVVFNDLTSYLQTWVTIGSPATRFTITPSATGFQVVGLAGLGSSNWPVAVKLPWDLIPGDSYYIEGVYSGGTITSGSGFFIGVDQTTTGDLSTSAKLDVARNGTLLPSTNNGLTADGTRTLSPAFLPAATAPVNGTIIGIAMDVLPDPVAGQRALRYRVYRNGVQEAVDVVVSGVTPAGAVVVGLMIQNGQTATITKILRKTVPGKTIWIDNAVTASGDGSRDSPLKTMLDVPAYMARIGYQDAITINWLSPNDYGYLQCKDTVAGKWTLNGAPGGKTILNGNLSESITWTVVAGTSNKVYRTPNQWGTEVRSQFNQAFLANTPSVSLNCAWIGFPGTILVKVTTPDGGVSMTGLTAGAVAGSGGFIYLRLPDGYVSGYDPALAVDLVLSRTTYVIEVVGAPEVNMNDFVLRYASQHCFIGGSGHGTLRNVETQWSGHLGNGFEVQNGSYRLENPKGKYIWNDCLGRTPRTDSPYVSGAAYSLEVINPEFSNTMEGDGISQHVIEAMLNGCRTRIVNPWIHHCNKCGVVSLDDLLMIIGGRIELNGAEQVSLFGVPTDSAVGRTQRAFLTGVTIDPAGLGTIGVHTLYTDGMALLEVDIDNCWIGTPAAGASNSELAVRAQTLTVSGVPQTRNAANNRITFRRSSTERDAGTMVRLGDGVASQLLTFSGNPASLDTVTIGAMTYTFNTVLGGANSIQIGANATVTRDNLVAAIMLTATGAGISYGAATVVHPTVIAQARSDGNMRVRAKTGGTSGNAIVSTETSSVLSWGFGTLAGGVAAEGTFVAMTSNALV